MKQSRMRRLFDAVVFFGALAFCPWALLHGETTDAEGWYKIETTHTVLYVHSLTALEILNSRIRGSPERFRGRESSPCASGSPLDQVGCKMDLLFKRVCTILDMQKKMNRINIRIYPGRRKLGEVYSRTVKSKFYTPGGSEPPRAWFVYEYNTIYLNLDDLNDHIVAHEMAHAVIDNFLHIRPPRVVAEILACYVDAHLYK